MQRLVHVRGCNGDNGLIAVAAAVAYTHDNMPWPVLSVVSGKEGDKIIIAKAAFIYFSIISVPMPPG